MFLYRILWGFWHFESRRISPNLNPKFRFQPRCGQAATWSEVTFTGTAPTVRRAHTAVWSEAANGMYIFGGTDGWVLNDLYFFDRQAPESIEVGKASEQFLLGVPKTLGFKFSGDRINIKHQLSSAVISPAILAHIFCVHFIFTTLLALRLRNLVNIVLCSGGAAWATLQSRVCFRTFWTGQLV